MSKKTKPPQTTVEQPLTTTDTEPVLKAAEEMLARAERASAAIREVLAKENCVIIVPTLNISTGRIFADIKIQAKPNS